MFVFMSVITLRRVGLWLLQTVLLPVRLPGSGSSFDRLMVTFLPGRRICCLCGCWCIAASLSDVSSTSYIERGSALLSLLLVRIHTDLSALLRFGGDTRLILPCLSGVEPARSLLSTIIDHKAVGCVCLVVLYQLFWSASQLSLVSLRWCLV